MSTEYFRISSGLKDLIGSELITDNFVAVFELVKNAFDAKSSEVKISFENTSSEDGKIIIQDNGKGMDYDDLFNKWLFVAYSAKRDGTEDEADYRDKIQAAKIYAGAKGVGRFSCDRLGRFLNLVTIKDGEGALIENLVVDWKKFEEDQKKEFIKIPVQHSVLKSTDYNIKHGTVLEISGIKKDDWNRTNLLRLKDRLSKLIRPDLNKSVKAKKFSIILNVPEEKGEDFDVIDWAKKNKLKEDQEGYIYRNTVNGHIQNFVFEELDIRTTKIESFISEDGEFVTTQLTDRDDLIYKIKERNSFTLLKQVSITLYFLNTSAKNIFSRRMGVPAVEFGSVFVYKNGFRIYPYGERGDDSFGLDNRAMQGYNRYISLRNLIGQIDIQGQNNSLKETTSRDGGLVKTKPYQELAGTDNGFLVVTLRRLEKFVVDVTKWGINDEAFVIKDDEESKAKLVKLISNIIDDQSLVEIEYNKKIIDIVNQKEEKSAIKLLNNFKRLAAESNDPELVKDTRRLEKRLVQQARALESAQVELAKSVKERGDLKKDLEDQVSETLFARAVVGTETKELLSIQHHIYRHSAQHISNYVDSLIDAINKDTSKEKLLELVNKISFENKKIITLSRFVNKANFDTTTTKIKADLVKFINEYALNVYQSYKHLAMNNQRLKIRTSTPKNIEFSTSFRPIEIIIIIDNLLNNSFKAKSQTVNLIWKKLNDFRTELHVVDDGIGVPNKNIDKIFDFRFTTTNGSGVGLYHTKQVVEKMGGTITLNNKINKGAEFIITFVR